MSAQEFYEKLKNADNKSYHLVLASLFRTVYGRSVKKNEWGYLRKLIKIYGPFTVYWSMLSSIHIRGDNPLPYINKVCMGEVGPNQERNDKELKKETEQLLAEVRSYVKPNWKEYLDEAG